MTEALVPHLVTAANVMQKAGGDDHVFIRVRFGDGDVERYAKHAVDMLAIVRAVSVAHALAHIGVQKGVSFAFHCGPSLIAHEEIEDVPAI